MLDELWVVNRSIYVHVFVFCARGLLSSRLSFVVNSLERGIRIPSCVYECRFVLVRTLYSTFFDAAHLARLIALYFVIDVSK